MKDIGDNLFIAIFNDAMDRDLVLMNGPWAFDKNLVLLKLFDGDQKVQGMQLTEASFWIQIHELPFKGMNEETATSVGNALGVLEEIDIPEDGITWGEFMRVQVRIDVSMPLLRRQRVKLGKEESIWVTLKYEKLPTFCYNCGILGHSERECRLVTQHEKSKDGNHYEYGSWLRATPGRRKTGSVTFEGAFPKRNG